MPKIAIEDFLYYNVNRYLLDTSSDDEEGCDCNCKTSQLINSIVHSYKDSDFEAILRISRKTFNKLTQLIKDRHVFENCCENVTTEQILWILLRYLGSNESLLQIHKSWHIPVSCLKSVISSAMEYFTKHINKYLNTTNHSWIPFPSDLFNKMIGDKYNICGILSVHSIEIDKPIVDSEKYKSTVNCFSLKIQGLISANDMFLDCYVGCGSLSDSELYKISDVHKKINKKPFCDYAILASCNPYKSQLIITDFDKECIQIAKQISEQCFNKLKSQFQRLQGKSLLVKDIDFSKKCIQTACILYNLCIKLND